MPKIVGPWIFVEPRAATDDVNLKVGGAFIVGDNETQHEFVTLQIQIWDDDTFGNSDMVPKDRTDTVQIQGPFGAGAHPFKEPVFRTRRDVARSETGSEDYAELYARMKATFGNPSGGRWINSANTAVKFR